MGVEGGDHLRAATHVEADPIGYVETGVAPCLLDLADQIASAALELELGCHRRVEHETLTTSSTATLDLDLAADGATVAVTRA